MSNQFTTFKFKIDVAFSDLKLAEKRLSTCQKMSEQLNYILSFSKQNL